MNKETYNKLSLQYQFLTNRFHNFHDYRYENYSRCYNPKLYGVRDDALETLKHFTKIDLRDVLTQTHIKTQHYGNEYLNTKLVSIYDDKICIHVEMGLLSFYFLISKLKEGIIELLDYLNHKVKTQPIIFREKNDGHIITSNVNHFDNLHTELNSIKDYGFIFHLFAQTNSHIIIKNWDNEIEIRITRIKNILETLTKYNFSKIDI